MKIQKISQYYFQKKMFNKALLRARRGVSMFGRTLFIHHHSQYNYYHSSLNYFNKYQSILEDSQTRIGFDKLSVEELHTLLQSKTKGGAALSKKEFSLFCELNLNCEYLEELRNEIWEKEYQEAIERFNKIIVNKSVFIERDLTI